MIVFQTHTNFFLFVFLFLGGGAEAQVAEAGLELTLLSKLTLDSPASTFQVLRLQAYTTTSSSINTYLNRGLLGGLSTSSPQDLAMFPG